MYGDYIKELTHGFILETEQGFVTYAFPDELNCYIRDIYIAPKYRNQNFCRDFADTIEDIARLKGCKYMLGSVIPSAIGSTNSLSVLLKCGFSLLSSSQDFIMFRKEI